MIGSINRYSIYLLLISLFISILTFIISPNYIFLALSIYTLIISINYLIISTSKQISENPADDIHKFGHGKFLSIGLIISTILFWLTPFILVYIFFQGFDQQIKTGGLVPAAVLILSNIVTSFLVLTYLRKEVRYFGFPIVRILISYVKQLMWVNFFSFIIAVNLMIIPNAIIEMFWILITIASLFFLGYLSLKAGIYPLLDSGLPPEDVREIESVINQIIRPPLFYSNVKTRISGEKQFLHFNLDMPGDANLSEAIYLKEIIQQEILQKFPNMEVKILIEPND